MNIYLIIVRKSFELSKETRDFSNYRFYQKEARKCAVPDEEKNMCDKRDR